MVVVSADGTVLLPTPAPNSADGSVVTPGQPAAAAAVAVNMIVTVEGVWTFGATPNASGDYPLLLNATQSGGYSSLLEVLNGNLYALTKSGSVWVRWSAAWVNTGSTTPPVQGTVAAKLARAPASAVIPDNAPAGTIVSTASVTMSPASAPFTGPLVSSNPLYAVRGLNIVLSRALTPADDGPMAVATTVTAVQ
jgi:hypothetical protein